MKGVIKVGSEGVPVVAQERSRQLTARPLGDGLFSVLSAKGVVLVPKKARNGWNWSGSFSKGEVVGMLAMIDGSEGEFEITETPWRGIVGAVG
jgi:hypothetical protein